MNRYRSHTAPCPGRHLTTTVRSNELLEKWRCTQGDHPKLKSAHEPGALHSRRALRDREVRECEDLGPSIAHIHSRILGVLKVFNSDVLSNEQDLLGCCNEATARTVGEPLVWHAALNGYWKVVDALFAKEVKLGNAEWMQGVSGSRLSAQTKELVSTLKQAHGRASCIRRMVPLVMKGVDVKNSELLGMLAIYEELIPIFKLILNYSAVDVNMHVGAKQETLLSRAVEAHNQAAVVLLLGHPRIDVNMRVGAKQETPLQLARRIRNLGAVSLLQKDPRIAKDTCSATPARGCCVQ